jgi:hypothetical protein
VRRTTIDYILCSKLATMRFEGVLLTNLYAVKLLYM